MPYAGSVAIAGDRIAWVGRDDEGLDRARGAAVVIDARGATVLPGFVDAHNHVRLGSNPGAVSLTGATSLEEIHDRIRAFVAAEPDATWVEGEGWNYAAIPGGRPTAAMLEGVTGGRPAFLFSYDVHTVWLNREAMTVFAIDRDTERLAVGHASSATRAASRPATSTTSRCWGSARTASATSAATCRGTTSTPRTSAWSRASIWRPGSGSPRSWSRRTGSTTSSCSLAPALRAISALGSSRRCSVCRRRRPSGSMPSRPHAPGSTMTGSASRRSSSTSTT